jgi:hypothetical protein
VLLAGINSSASGLRISVYSSMVLFIDGGSPSCRTLSKGQHCRCCLQCQQ